MQAFVELSERIEQELVRVGAEFNQPPLSSLHPAYRNTIRSFLLRAGEVKA